MGRGGPRRRLVSPTDRGGEEAGVPVGDPVLPEEPQRGAQQGHVAILAPLAAVDVDHPPGAVEVGDLQVQPFLQPEATGVNH
jgi:hypothetical protein